MASARAMPPDTLPASARPPSPASLQVPVAAAARKRVRADSSYARQRNVTACVVCRNRKTKCDNRRPMCSFCEGASVICIYEDSRSDYSNYDPASLCIIDRIDRLSEQLSGCLDTMTHETKCVSEQGWRRAEPVPSPPVLESTLSWAAFEVLKLGLQDKRLALHYAHDDRSSGIRTISKYSDLEPTDRMAYDPFIPTAIGNFLEHVHSKNPILDQQYLADSVELYLSGEPTFDEQCALVSICAALGLIAKPFVTAKDPCWTQSRSIIHGEYGRLAAQLSTRARAMLGVAAPSLVVIQCLFFCGVYDMYLVRPIDAYLYFNRASTYLKLHLLGKQPLSTQDAESREGRLLRRLYWSCMQSECELAAELSIATCGLEDMDFPYAFPSPPLHMTSIDESSSQMRSWLYYFAETSLRRIGKEIATTLHYPSHSSCMRDLDVACVRAERLNNKLEAWMAHLPGALVIEQSPSETANELSLHIRSRYLMCRSWIHQPFLQYLIHAAPHQLEEHKARIETLAGLCLECAMEITKDVTMHHRHHGTWFVMRLLAQNALFLLAAALSNAIATPHGWEMAVGHVIEHIGYWAEECSDLQATVRILNDILAAVKARQI